ncbi:MAG: thiamine diphosphokinase [Microthrixaceae bacterium]|nr:thiamine diphosphokinase [Microthrixaceae bacterium]
MTTAVILVAGPMPSLDGPEDAFSGSTLGDRLRSRVNELGPDLVVAADGGLDLALGLGYSPDHVVGDMDSVSSAALSRARSQGLQLTEVPVAKDASDYELALDLAVERGADHLMVIGGASGRLDHVFATLLTLTHPKFAGLVIEGWLVDNYIAVINGRSARQDDVGLSRSSSRAVVTGDVGDQLSVFALNGPATGVTTSGLRWVLDDALLTGGTSLGVSNELIESTASISATDGTLAVIKAASAKAAGHDQEVGER